MRDLHRGRMRATTRLALLALVLAAGFVSTGCPSNLYTGVDASSPWSGPPRQPIGGGVLGYPF